MDEFVVRRTHDPEDACRRLASAAPSRPFTIHVEADGLHVLGDLPAARVTAALGRRAVKAPVRARARVRDGD